MPTDSPSPGPARTFSQLLNRAIDVMRFGGKPANSSMIAEGTGLSIKYVTDLRSGKRANPSEDVKRRIATFLGISVDYFNDPQRAEDIDAQLELVEALASTDLRRLAFRGQGLSSRDLAAAVQLLRTAMGGSHNGPPAARSDPPAPPEHE